MQAHILCSRQTLASAALFASVAFTPATLWAQGASGNVPNDYYRAELVILQRLVDPAGIEEQMANKSVEPVEEAGKTLWVEQESGEQVTELNLVPRNQLHLGEAANRLERSGNYRVLASAGWYEAFPPDYEGEPLRVAIGDWLAESGQRAVEGQITIDRQRYLHVNVQLNHWAVSDDPEAVPAEPETPPQTEAVAEFSDQDSGNTLDSETGGSASEGTGTAYQLRPAPVELVTWIRETRRMRSEEIHFIDSPTVGVLVFFKKIEG
ncbi:MAG: CsiV family protein [Pseudomonadota bacterium]|nr:CsiV family protein [Pseudomonadota bacterium]